ncbi:MAG TPA: Disulfide-rich peptide [Caudoviricetes sp.]|nr:MAG TPA: Disulfide-rich peptide [Caudoviricetes sp.]
MRVGFRKNLTLCTGGQRCWVRIPPGPIRPGSLSG